MDIDYQAVIDHLQGENEELRVRVMHLLLERRTLFSDLADWWALLDGIERYYIIAGSCAVVIAVVAIVGLFRR